MTVHSSKRLAVTATTLLLGLALRTEAQGPLHTSAQAAAPVSVRTDTTPQAVTPPASATALIADGVKSAAATNRTVLVHFGASWCGFCRKFTAFLHSPSAEPIISKYYVPVHLTIMESPQLKALENPGGDSIAKANGLAGGIPFFFFLDGNGQKIGDSNALPDNSNIGHPVTVAEVKAFGGLLQKTAPRMTDSERTKLISLLTIDAEWSFTSGALRKIMTELKGSLTDEQLRALFTSPERAAHRLQLTESLAASGADSTARRERMLAHFSEELWSIRAKMSAELQPKFDAAAKEWIRPRQ